MIDIRYLLAGLTQSISRAEFPEANSLAATLDLDISRAAITKTKDGNLGINGARLNRNGILVGVACGVTPKRLDVTDQS